MLKSRYCDIILIVILIRYVVQQLQNIHSKQSFKSFLNGSPTIKAAAVKYM